MQVERFELPLVLSCCAASSNGFWHTRFREDIEDLVKLTVDKMDTGPIEFRGAGTLLPCSGVLAGNGEAELPVIGSSGLGPGISHWSVASSFCFRACRKMV